MIFYIDFTWCLTGKKLGDNYKEKILLAYLAGRGNKNVHVITQNDSVLTSDHSSNRVENVVGPYMTFTERGKIFFIFFLFFFIFFYFFYFFFKNKFFDFR